MQCKQCEAEVKQTVNDECFPCFRTRLGYHPFGEEADVEPKLSFSNKALIWVSCSAILWAIFIALWVA